MQAESGSIQYAMDPAFPRGFVSLMTGHGGAGKTMFLLTLMAHAVCGSPWAGMHPAGVLRVLYVSLEDPPELMRIRLRRICEHYACLDPALIETNFSMLDGSGEASALVVEANIYGSRETAVTGAMHELESAGVGFDAVIIDNASDAYAGNENERRGVQTFMRRLAANARLNKAAWILVAHIDKTAARHGAGGNSYSGSTAWHNACRSRLALIPDKGLVRLVHEKNNLGKLAEPVPMGWTDAGVLIPVASCAQTSAEAIHADATCLLPGLLAAHSGGVIVPTATSGPSTDYHALVALPELPGELRGRDGKRRVSAALVMLCRRGLVSRVEYRAPGRHSRERWQLTPDGLAAASGVPVGATGATRAISAISAGLAQDGVSAPVESARVNPPIPPAQTGARAEGRASQCSALVNETGATGATDAEQSGGQHVRQASTPCARCDGEGCAWCQGAGEPA